MSPIGSFPALSRAERPAWAAFGVFLIVTMFGGLVSAVSPVSAQAAQVGQGFNLDAPKPQFLLPRNRIDEDHAAARPGAPGIATVAGCDDRQRICLGEDKEDGSDMPIRDLSRGTESLNASARFAASYRAERKRGKYEHGKGRWSFG